MDSEKIVSFLQKNFCVRSQSNCPDEANQQVSHQIPHIMLNISVSNRDFPPLQLGLWRLETGHQHVPYIASCLAEVEAHSLRTEVLGYNVELDAANKELSAENPSSRHFRGVEEYSRVLVNHVGDTPTLVNHLTPPVPIEILAAQLAAANVPCTAVRIRWVFEDLWHLFALSN